MSESTPQHLNFRVDEDAYRRIEAARANFNRVFGMRQGLSEYLRMSACRYGVQFTPENTDDAPSET